MERRLARERYRQTRDRQAPPGMIARATAARLAGDWAAACAAAMVDLDVTWWDVTERFGAAEAGRIEAELAGFAPDLLRRYLPDGRGDVLQPGATFVLSRRAGPFERPASAHRPGTAVLVVTTPWSLDVAQRLRLRVVDAALLGGSWYDLPAWMWHAGAVAERRWAYGASAARLPWHFADGTPYPQGVTTPPDGAPDRAAEFERLTGASTADERLEAFRAAGIEVEPDSVPRWYAGGDLVLEYPSLPLLAAEARRLAHRYGRTTFLPSWGRTLEVPPDAPVRVAAATRHAARPGPIPFFPEAPLEAALLRYGTLTPDDLHPLVHEALYPGRTQQGRAGTHETHRQIRVRCGGDWHIVEVTGAALAIWQHDATEMRRELMLRQLGGTVSGCAAALAGFRTGRKPVPKDVRKARQSLFARAFHGDTDSVVADLEVDADPQLRGPGGISLMHRLAHVGHERVLPLLLAAGHSPDERDAAGRTPLHAAAESADEGVMAALIAAGAAPDGTDAAGHTAAEILGKARRKRFGARW